MQVEKRRKKKEGMMGYLQEMGTSCPVTLGITFAVILYNNVLKYVLGKLVKFPSNITGNEQHMRM